MESALRIRNEHRNTILMTRHCYWLQPIRSTTQIWVVTRHQYGISAPVSQASFGGKPVVTSRNAGFLLRLLESISVKQSISWCRTANNFLNFNSTKNQVDDEPLCGCATSKSLFVVKKAPFLKQNSLEAFTLHSVRK